MAKTYQYLAELIRDAYYKIIPNDDHNYSLRFFAEQVASEVAEMATMNAFENSNNGETTYANDQFISVYKNLPIVSSGGEKYTVLPATPTALPNNAEVAEIKVTGSKCVCIPMKNHMSFAQELIGIPNGMVLYKIEGGKIVYKTNNPLLEGTVSMKLVGAVEGMDLLSSQLNIPKNFESRILRKVLSTLMPIKQLPIDIINDSVPNPS